MAESINPNQAKRLLNHFIDTNRMLQDAGQSPVAIGLTGQHGIGKTDIVEQVAKERNMGFVKLSLHELEEVGDLIGYPVKEYRIINKETNKGVWVAADMLESVNDAKWKKTPKSRMAYAKPAWVPEFNENGTILLLDDYARSSQMLVQATMGLIKEGKYVSWSLPKYTTVVLTANPDNGEFNVCSLDSAQKTRFADYNLEFEIDSWAKWAEAANIDSRAINFALSYSQDLFYEKNGVTIACPRSYVTFVKAISSIKDWKKDLALILLISKGCFDDKDNAVGTIFTTFVKNGYDKLISPKDVFMQSWDTVQWKLKKAIYGEGDDFSDYNAAIASMMSTRLVNWLNVYFNTKGYESKPIVERLTELFNSHLFSEDLMFHIIKTSISNHPQQLAKLMQNPEITQKIVL